MPYGAGLLALSLIWCAAWSVDLSAALGQEEVPAYAPSWSDRDAGDDAWRRGELRRRADVARQIGTIQYVRWLNGLPPSVPHAPWAADRAAYYAYGGRDGAGARCGVFQPWPYLPGDVWGFSYDRPVPQSVGRRQVQTGPRSWQSHDVYPNRRHY